MGKGKGRQSGGFSSKSERAAHACEWYDQQYYREEGLVRSRPRMSASSSAYTIAAAPPLLSSQRPRLTMLGQLKGILRERQFEENQEFMERRRRDGFVPPRSTTFPTEASIPIMEDHPPGWILDFGKGSCSTNHSSSVVESLEQKCLKVLNRFIMDYLEAMGREDLHGALSLLPAETLTALSIAVSQGNGISNDLAYCIGKHAHVEELSFRSSTLARGDCHNCLMDEGLFELVPRSSFKMQHNVDAEDIIDDWEETYNEVRDDDWETRHALQLDVLQLDGVNVGLKRLELIDCLYLSSKAVVALLEMCACITHLSLSGSIQAIDDGLEVMQALPELLPDLQVLDVTRCGWVTGDLLATLHNTYVEACQSRKPPLVLSQGFLPCDDFIGFEGQRRSTIEPCSRSAGW